MPIPEISPQFDVRRLVKKGVDRRGRPVGAFETRKKVKKESRHRFRLLCENGGDAEPILPLLLYTCTDEFPCCSSACSKCSRTRRIQWAAAVLEFLAAYDLNDLRFLTIINPGDAIPAGKLDTFNPKALIHRLRRQLERAGTDKRKSFLIGFIDAEWDEGWEVYQPHLHLICHNITNKQLKPLIETWPSDPQRVRVRKRLERIHDLPRVTAYLDKSWWPSVARGNNPREVHPHDKQRPPKHIEQEILNWLHDHQPADLRMMFGIKSYHGKLVKS